MTHKIVHLQWRAPNSMTVGQKNSSTVGQEFFYGISRPKNYRKAFTYLLDAAANGYVHAQNLVGYCYSQGLGVRKHKVRLLFGTSKLLAPDMAKRYGISLARKAAQ